MDPHSRRSQFNHRTPKAGPVSRNIDSLVSPQRQESSKMPHRKTSTSSSAAATANLLIRRPIATNSRVKQDEMFKRDMYLSVVTNALNQKANGVSDTFDELVAQFNISSSSSSSQQPVQIDTAQIRLWLLALSHVVSRLERMHSTLVDAIVNMPWTTFDSATVKSYTIFIGMLLSARPEYLSLVLTKIAHGFTYQSGLQALDASMPSTSSAPLTRRIIYDRLHFLLRHVITLVPTLPSTLQPLLIRYFPHKRQNQVAQTTYIRNLLRVSNYCPELGDKILATIVDRAIQIDVEIQIELEELEEEENVDDHDVFEIDPFDVVLGQESSTSDSDDDSDGDGDDNFSDLSSEGGDLDDFDLQRHTEVPMNVKHIQEMVKKLDVILTLLFEHFERIKVVDGKNADIPPMSPLELPPLPPLDAGPLTPTDLRSPLSLSFNSNASSTPQTTTSTANTPAASTSKLLRKPNVQTSLRSQFHSLLSIFDRTILRTFKSRYTQFLVFWFASLDPEFADVFQGMLVERALMPSNGGLTPHTPENNDNLYGDADTGESASNSQAHTMTPELTRAAAASYIGSFVSRAKFVDREGARRVVSVLCEYLRTHLDGVEADVRLGLGFGTGSVSSNMNATAAIGAILASGQHTVFYAVTQAVFLIFCFRWRDLVGSDDYAEEESYVELDLESDGRSRKAPGKDKWMPELGVLKRVVTSILNPLKVCSPNVVMQFARVAQATDFVYCFTMLEMNKRNDMSFASISSTASSSSRSRAKNTSSSLTLLNTKVLYQPENSELNTFFPFDPYRLPKSNTFIQGVYREWSSVAIDDDEDDEGDSDESDEEIDQLSSDADYRLSGLDIPRDKSFGGQKSDDDGGLGESLGTMSISPARMSISVGMRR